MSEENINFDLRRKLLTGETYHLFICDGFMAMDALYRFNGENFIMELYHNNNRFFLDFKPELNKKDFKSLAEKCQVKYLGVFHTKREGS